MIRSVALSSKGRRSPVANDSESMGSTSKRPRTAEDFYLFCSFILEHEKYEVLKREEVGEPIDSPLGSTGSAVDSVSDSLGESLVHSPSPEHILPDSSKSEHVPRNNSDSNIDSDMKPSDVDTAKATSTAQWNWNGMHFSDEDSYDLVTCYCAKPFAGRAMIECSKCLTWIHLSCAKIKKNNIPDEFICIKCKSQRCNNIPENTSLKPKKRLSV